MNNHINHHHGRKTFWSVLLIMAVMIFAAAGAYAAKNKATTIRLARTEGTVTIKNSSKGELTQSKDMRLYSGDHQITDKESYAWMSLDDSKAVKLDENSESELRKKGKKLQILLDSGNMFFNVTVPLEKEESMNIRTSTMVAGVRGTCGWFEVSDDWATRVYLLTGKLECLVVNPIDDNSENSAITPGNYSDFLVFPAAENQGQQTTRIESGSFTKEDIPGFVLVELVGDDVLIQKIYEESGIDLRGLTMEEAKAKLAKDQEEHAKKQEKIDDDAIEEQSIIAMDPVWVVDDGDGDGQNAIVWLTMPQKAITVQKYLDLQRVKKVILLPGKGSKEDNTLSVDIAFNVPAGKVLEAQKNVYVNVEKDFSFTVNGTANLGDDVTNEGNLIVKSNHTLKVEGVFYNVGTFENTATGRVLLMQGMFTDGIFKNSGVIEAGDDATGDVLITIQGGTFNMEGGNISSEDFDSIVFIDSDAGVVLVLSGGEIVNEREDGATIRISSDNFQIGALGTDVAGISDTLLGKGTNYEKYGVASVYRTDQKYHLISLDSVDSYPVVLGKFVHGTVTVPERVEVGAKVTLVPIPDKGYHLESISVNYYDGAGKALGQQVSLAADYSFSMPQHDVIVSATFEENTADPGEVDPEDKTYQISIGRTSGGSVSANMTSAKEGEEVVLSVTESAGHTLESLEVKDEDGNAVGLREKGNGYAFTMPDKNVTVNATFRAQKVNVVFYDEDGRTVLNTQSLDYGAVPTYAGATPVKEATAAYTYAFGGWKSGASTYAVGTSLPAVTGNATFVAYYNETAVANTNQPTKPTTYTVTWVNANGTVLETDSGLKGGEIPEYNGEVPTMEEDAQFVYVEFIGWKNGDVIYGENDTFPAVTGNVTYTATYETTTKTYEITWADEDGSVIKVDENVPYGTVPSYTGQEPTKAATAQYTYAFSGWDSAVVAVTGDATYKAVYSATVNTYTITWKDDQGNVLETSENVPYGTMPSYNTTPTKEATAQYTYGFDGWTPEVVSVTGDATYTATFTSIVNQYTVTWKNENGSILTTSQVEYGSRPVYPGADDPAKEATAQYSYAFYGWDVGGTIYAKGADLPEITGPISITANYTFTVNSYNVYWYNYDGSRLATTQVQYGSTPAYSGTSDPIRPQTAEYDYAFAGWATSTDGMAMDVLPTVTGEASYYATYTGTKRSYDVRFHVTDDQGNDNVTTQSVEYGTTPSYEGTLPSKPLSAQYEYAFTGWAITDGGSTLEAPPSVTGEADYYAIFGQQLREYDVTFYKEDGTTELKTVKTKYGEAPVYGEDDPTKEQTAEYTYAFSGWMHETDASALYATNNLSAITGETYYVAQFTGTTRSYAVIFNNYDGTQLDSQTVEYGQVPSFSGEAAPSKQDDETYTYTFEGWSDGTTTYRVGAALPAVTEEVTYTAEFSNTYKEYVVTWQNYDGGILETDTGAHFGDVLSYDGETPTKPQTTEHTYVFDGWSDRTTTYHLGEDLPTVSGDMIMTANYKEETRKYTVNFYLDQTAATPLYTSQFDYHTNPAYVGDEPVKAATDEYTYEFDGWITSDGNYSEGTLPAVESDVNYYAHFAVNGRTYAVNFNMNASGDTTAVINGTAPTEYTYGVGVELPQKVTRTNYIFDGWYESPNPKTGETPVTEIGTDEFGDKTFFAKWKQPTTGLFFTITEEGASDVVLTLYGTEGTGRTEITSKELDSNNYFTDNHSYYDVTKVVIAENIKPANMASAFSGMENLTSIEGLDKINTEDVTSMYATFYNCYNLDQALDLSGFNTANVTNMAQMFEDCQGITSLDLSSFDTSNVTLMQDMFYNCSSLTTIYVSDSFDVSGVTDSPVAGLTRAGMFYDCVALRGGNGTRVYIDENGEDDDPHNSFDKDYAWIDGKNGQPGYFTEKGASYVSHAISVVSSYTNVLAPNKTSATTGETVTVTVNVPTGSKCTAVFYYNDAYERVDLLSAPLTTDSFTFSMPDEDVELYATISYLRTITANYFTAGGNVNIPASAAAGEWVSFSVTLNDGYVLNGATLNYEIEDYSGKVTQYIPYSDDITITNGVGGFTMPDAEAKVIIDIVGDAGNTYQLSLGECDNGLVRISYESSEVPAGTLVGLSDVPDDGYKFDHFELKDETGAPVDMLSDTTFYMPEKNVIINAYFNKLYTIDYAYVSANSNSIYGDTEVAAGQEASFYVMTYYYSNPRSEEGDCYRNETLTVKDEDGNDVPFEVDHGSGSVVYYKFTMPEKNVTIDGTFGTYYKIVLKQGEHGTATVDKPYAKYMEEVTITVTPDAGYGLWTAYCATYRVQKETTAITSRFIDQGDGTYKYTFQNKASSNVPSDGTVFSFDYATKFEGSMEITGTPQVGETLTANVTTSAEGNLYYVWKRHQETYDVTLDSGIDETTYVVTEADAGYNIECRVTCGSYGGYLSDSVDIVPPATPHSVHVYYMEPNGNAWVASTSMAGAELKVDGNTVTAVHNGEEATVEIVPSSEKYYVNNLYVYCDADGLSGYELTELENDYGNGYFVTSEYGLSEISFTDYVEEDEDYYNTYYVFVKLASRIEIQPNYLEDGGTVSVSVDHGKGYEDTVYAEEYEDARLSIIPNTGYSIGEVYYLLGSTKTALTVSGGYYEFVVPSGSYDNLPVYVEFVNDAGTDYDIHVNGTHGSATTTVTSADSASPVNVTKTKGGRIVTIVLAPDAGYGLDEITVIGADGAKVTVNEDNTFVMPEQEVTINVTFTRVYTLSSNHDNDTDYACVVEFYKKDGNKLTRVTQCIPGETILMRIQTEVDAQWVEPDGSGINAVELYVTTASGTVIPVTLVEAGSRGGSEYEEDLYNDYSFTMPDSDVYVKVVAGETHYIGFASMPYGNVKSYVSGAEQDYAISGQTVTLEVIPQSGYYCTELIVKDEATTEILSVSPVTQNTYEFTMPGLSVSVRAKFAKMTTSSVNLEGQVNDVTYGTITPSMESANVGSSVTVTATPVSASYYLAKLEARYAKAGGGYTSETIYEATDITSQVKTFNLIAANVDTVYYATFSPTTGYALTTNASSNISAEQGGTITLNKSAAKAGDVVTATVTSETGFTVNSVYALYETPILTDDGTDTGVKKENRVELTAAGANQYTFTVPSDVNFSGLTVHAEFTSVGKKLTLKPVTGGKIEATNDQGTTTDNVLSGSVVTIEVTPNANLVVDEATLKAVDTATGNTSYALTKVDDTHWTFTMPDEEVTISVGLKANASNTLVTLTMPQTYGEVQNYLNMDEVAMVTIAPNADESKNVFNVTGTLTIPVGKTLIISDGVTVSLSEGAKILNLSNQTIHNAGTIFICSGATLQNGDSENPGALINEENGVIMVDNGGSLVNENGEIQNMGTIQYEDGATISGAENLQEVISLGKTGDVFYRMTYYGQSTRYYSAEIFGVGATGDYTYQNKSPFVSGYKTSLAEVIVREGVTRIGDSLFEDCTKLEDVTLPESLQSVGGYAFSNTGIKELNLPKGCSKYGYGAFKECTYLASVTLPDRIEVTDDYTAGSLFFECTRLSEVDFPETFDVIPDGMFYRTAFTSIRIPGTVKEICGGAFGNCGSLNTVVIEDGVKSIGRQAFYNDYNLTSVTMPDSITKMDGAVFQKCSNLKSVHIPNGMQEIAAETFSECSWLTSVDFGDNIQAIYSEAFYNCTSLQGIDLNNSIQLIGNKAFYGCKKLNNVVIGSNVTEIGECAFFSCTSLSNLTIQTEILKSVGYSAFSGCAFSSISLPESVTEIGTSLFNGCKALTQFTMPSSITVVPDSMFKNCTSLTKVTLAQGTTKIGYDAFHGCTSLYQVNLPDTLKYIDSYAFYQTKLENLQVPAGVETISNNAFGYCASLVSATLPDSVTTLGDSVFQYCSSLVTITLPSGLTSIPSSTFSGCTNLQSLLMPNGVTSIGYNAFYGCKALTDVTIPASVTSMSSSVFYNCENLETVRFADTTGNLKSIGGSSFYGCPKLAHVYYGGTKEQWDAISISGGNDTLKAAEITYGTVSE